MTPVTTEAKESQQKSVTRVPWGMSMAQRKDNELVTCGFEKQKTTGVPETKSTEKHYARS